MELLKHFIIFGKTQHIRILAHEKVSEKLFTISHSYIRERI